MEGNDHVETELVKLLHTLGNAMDTLENLTDENKPALIDEVRNIISHFQVLHSLEPQITGTVPFDLIQQIDENNNPDIYSQKLLDDCKIKAKRVEEKQKMVHDFKDQLDSLIAANFPGEGDY